MALDVTVTHTKVATLPDSPDPDQIQPSDWNDDHEVIITGAADDVLAKVSSNDTTAGYLNGKLVAGTGITLTENNNGANETLTVASTGVAVDEKVKTSVSDTTAGYLGAKMVSGNNRTLITETTSGSRQMQVSALGGAQLDLVTGSSSDFGTSVGSWTNSGGTLSRDTTPTYYFASHSGSLKFITTAQNQYVELAISGTFRSANEYQAMILIRTEGPHAASGESWKIELGVIGTDANNIQSSGSANGQLRYQPYVVRWKPNADRTGVKLRFTRPGTETGTINWHFGWVRVIECARNDVGLGLQRMSNYDDTLMLGLDFGGTSITGGTNPAEDAHIYLSRSTFQAVAGGQTNGSSGVYLSRGFSSPTEGDLQLWSMHTADDFANWGIQFVPGDFDVALYMSQKDATTIQMYSAYGDHTIELADSATTGWKMRSDDDAYAWPAKGMLPQYSTEPSSPVEGQSYYDTTDHMSRTWDGTVWKDWWT